MEEGTRVDAAIVEARPHHVEGRARVAQDDRVHPVDVACPRCLRMEGEAACAREGSQGLGVPPGDLPLLLDEGGELLRLRYPYRGLEVGHAVIEADHLVPVASLGIHAVVAEEPEP